MLLVLGPRSEHHCSDFHIQLGNLKSSCCPVVVLPSVGPVICDGPQGNLRTKASERQRGGRRLTQPQDAQIV